METITRQQKIDHIAATVSSAPNLHLDEAYVRHLDLLDMPSPENMAPNLPIMVERRLADFTYWRKTSSVAKEMLADRHSTIELLPYYARAINGRRKELEKHIPLWRERLGERLSTLADTGDIPKVLAERFHENPASTHLSLSITDSSYDPFAAAFTLTQRHSIHFRPWRSKEDWKRSYVHESMHMLSSATQKVDGKAIKTTRTGLGAVVYGEGNNSVMRHRAINEGVTEYLTLLVIKGSPGKVSAVERGSSEDSGIYVPEREIVSLLAKRIGLGTILEAYAEDYVPGEHETMQHTRACMRAIRRTYGPGFLHKLDSIDREQGIQAALEFMQQADQEVEAAMTPRQRRQQRLAKIAVKLGMEP